jgi:glycosyltransferase involved in cell wall biosynthesis
VQASAPHIGLNLVFLVPGETGGMEIYARELIAAMVALAQREVRFSAFVNREAASSAGPWHDMMDCVVVPVRAAQRSQWVRGEQQYLPRLAMRAGCDLVHSLGSTAPLWGRFRRVVTIHDLAYRAVPGAHLGLLGLGMRVLVPSAAHRSHRIIADSQSTRDDLLRYHRLAPERIDVVPLGVHLPGDRARMSEHDVRERHRLGSRVLLLCVSAKRPHKNLVRLIEALALIPSAQRPVLVIAGYGTAHERELIERARELGVSDDLRLPGWVPEAELEGLYAVARAFIFPSLYEGFGLPVLEAMARGVPVAISKAIVRLLNDDALVRQLHDAGLRRAALFSWEETARGTLASYRRALT